MATTQRTITIVLGMHRSGTSLASHLLSLLGRDMADEITAHESNAYGHWERWELVGFHDRVLATFGRGPPAPRRPGGRRGRRGLKATALPLDPAKAGESRRRLNIRKDRLRIVGWDDGWVHGAPAAKSGA
jgi:hypothetical protein